MISTDTDTDICHQALNLKSLLLIQTTSTTPAIQLDRP